MASHKEAPDVFHVLSLSKVRHLAVARVTIADDLHLYSQMSNICYSIGIRALSLTTIECGIRKAAASPLAYSERSAARLLTARLGCLISGRRLASLSGCLVGRSQLAAVPVHF